MNTIFKVIGKASLVVATGFMIGSCTSDADSAGLEYMPDMYRSAAIEPYVDYGEIRGRLNPELKEIQSAMTPPNHTIPYYGTDKNEVAMMLPYHRLPGKAFITTHGLYGMEYSMDADPEAEYKKAAMDMNPLKLNAENAEMTFKKGKDLYAANCMHCHGEKGDGNGPMVQSGAYTGAANLSALTIADGQMFYSIYYGKNMMGSHASIVNKKEIWTLVHYIRKMQKADYGTVFDAAGNVAMMPMVADTAKAPAVQMPK